MNPYVFIVGCPRSGTTLLSRIADAHSELAVMPEQHWLPRFWQANVGISADGFVTSDILDWLLSDRRFALLDLPIKPLVDLVEDAPPISYADFVSRLFDVHGARQRKRFVGEKTPKYVHQLATLHALWPFSRFVHLIRDGRDVALSLLDWPKVERNAGRFPSWRDDPLTTAALYWEWCVRSGREASQALGSALYHEQRYESLVAAPAGECTALCTFLGLRFEGQMLEFHEGRARSKPGLSAKKAWLPVTAGLRSWQRDMAANDVARFEAVAGDLLEELGYERATLTTRSQRLHASRVRQRFVAHLRRWGRTVPAAWRGVAA